MDLAGNWINLDADFGAPIKTFFLPARKIVALGDFRLRLGQAKNPTEMADAFRDLVLHFRPELKGLLVIGIHGGGGMVVHVTVVHDSFPRMSNGVPLESEAIEPCAACKGPIIFGKMSFLALIPGEEFKTVDVCSDACREIVEGSDKPISVPCRLT